MKVNYVRETVVFQILSELSAWNGFVCSPELKRMWMEISGGAFNRSELRALKSFTDALREGPDDAWFFFLSSSRKERMEKKENPLYIPIFDSIEKCENVLKSRIELLLKKYYLPTSSNLVLLKKQISKSTKFFHKLEQFIGARSLKRFSVYVQLSKNTGFEAWAAAGNKIVLFPSAKVQNPEMIKAVVHEYGHLLARNNAALRQIIEKITRRAKGDFLAAISKKTGLPPEVVVEELFFSAIVPEGALGAEIDGKQWRLSSRAGYFEKIRFGFAQIMNSAVKSRMGREVSFKQYVEKFERNLRIFLKLK